MFVENRLNNKDNDTIEINIIISLNGVLLSVNFEKT